MPRRRGCPRKRDRVDCIEGGTQVSVPDTLQQVGEDVQVGRRPACAASFGRVPASGAAPARPPSRKRGHHAHDKHNARGLLMR